MRIDSRAAPTATPAASAAAAARTASAPTARFEVGGRKSPTANAAGGARASAPLATLDAILALQQEPEDNAERKRRSARRGQGLLDALDSLKIALIGGTISPGDLSRIATSLAGAGPSGDPGLDDVVAQIELRAKVELAKLGRADLI